MTNANFPVIPETITVHLGRPNESAENLTLPFSEYIANVASSEIYPTWPEEAIRANILAQISYTLNRVYTEFYRSRGYDFDITNSTSVDQSFVKGREIFDNINEIVGDIFNDYIRRDGAVEPLFAAYCDGYRTVCDGLSQWGSVSLANEGYLPIDILKYYYGDNIGIVFDAPVSDPTVSAPPAPLSVGLANDDVKTVQIRLNRISANYPGIPKIAEPNGVFSFDTEEAVKEFQKIFGLTQDGIVGKATWYAILRIYAGVKKLSELNSEGITLDEISKQYPNELSLGSTGEGVAALQYYISYLSLFYDTVPTVVIDGIFGSATENAVKDLQETFGLPVNGIVDRMTWDKIYNNYLSFIETIPLQYTEGVVVPFGGVTLRFGVEGDSVRLLQEYLNYISDFYPDIPSVNPTGYFGEMTRASVIAFQNRFSLPATGTVEAITWNAIIDIYEDLYTGARIGESQYPGYDIGR